jgi:PAS domain S-box-containing protein
MGGDMAKTMSYEDLTRKVQELERADLDRRRAEEALRESEQFLKEMFNAIQDGISVLDKDLSVINTNHWMEQMYASQKPLAGRKCYHVYQKRSSPCPWCPVLRTIETGRMHSEIVPYPSEQDPTGWIELSSFPIKDKEGNVTGIIEYVKDITERVLAEQERERLQNRLLQSQKMESVGRLAGGVAHDFNNMLGVILGHTELAMKQVGPHSPLHADLQEILKATQRSAALTRQLLAFARRQTVAPKVLDLNETVAGMLNMLRRLIGEDIHLSWTPGESLWSVRIDPAQIDQIFANLCVNARDAISGVGKIRIKTKNVVLDDSFCRKHAGALPGEYVMMAVSDDGCGMEKETLDSLFEPFFTTKDVGIGTGLGLATVYGIVRQNNGFIWVVSKPKEGATFKIYFPRSQETADREDAATNHVASRGTETVLLVEDEAAILNLGKTVLERLGYRVLPARTPGEALAAAERHKEPIHLLVTDVIMPEMNGKELKTRIQKLKTDIKVLFISGYPDAVIGRGILERDVSFLQKPFTIDSLANKVREVLDMKKPSYKAG